MIFRVFKGLGSVLAVSYILGAIFFFGIDLLFVPGTHDGIGALFALVFPITIFIATYLTAKKEKSREEEA